MIGVIRGRRGNFNWGRDPGWKIPGREIPGRDQDITTTDESYIPKPTPNDPTTVTYIPTTNIPHMKDSCQMECVDELGKL